MTALFYLFSTDLIRLLGAAPETVAHGGIYLRIVAIGLLFEYLNKIGSRAFAGIGDTFTPMVVRAGGALVNIVLNAVFILGLDMGAAGAALGTVIATGLITFGLAWGFLGRSYPIGTVPPVRFRLHGPHWERALGRQLLVVSAPLVLRRLATSIVVFPFLAIAAVFGTVVVAALEVSRQVRGLMNSLNWGFSIASSTLVGQELGRGNETEAEAYGWDILRLAMLSYVVLAALVVALAGPIAGVFVDDPAALETATAFVVVGAVSAVGLGLDGATNGALRGGGDTRWPFYGRVIGLYVLAVPIATLGVATPLGVAGLYVALLAETFVPGAINLYRFRTNRWKSVSRQFRPGRAD
jgi:putative MATE family efflux protein